jgi:hypothetical protein
LRQEQHSGQSWSKRTDAGREDAVLSKEVPVGLVCGSSLTALRGLLECDPLDPLAVALTLSAPGQQVRWVFAREVLVAGLGSPAGEGDVRVRPGWRRGMRVVAFELGDQGDVFEAPRRALEEFVAETHCVEAGLEEALGDALTAELARITGSARGS